MEEMAEQCTEMMAQMGNMMGNGMMSSGMMGNVTATTAWWASPWYWLGWVLILALLAALFLALLWTVRRVGQPVPATVEGETPLMILKRRYALGEVSPEQFDSMKRQLSER